MNVIGIVVLVILGASMVTVIAGRFGLLEGKPPRNLGVKEGRLKPPSLSPNSVSSQADLYPDHPQQRYASIASFEAGQDAQASVKKIEQILQSMDGVRIVERQTDYFYAQCQTPLLRFTDDVEFWLDRASNTIHVRSASRLGRRDFGVNRKRVEQIRAAYLIP
ncbi:DUF1499 domain-containing protein [Rhodoferax sp.]|jgi:uncharacterized protein (DUF1499 family)|uniref:DUF1499 domain-containing protein n=1 Tax=Rhodoferax sp. TaxID=50421 RepID=UPI003784FB87